MIFPRSIPEALGWLMVVLFMMWLTGVGIILVIAMCELFSKRKEFKRK